MESKISVAINEKGHAVVTHSMPLSDYCFQSAKTLRAMVQVVSNAKLNEQSGELVKPLMELLRVQVDQLEPLFTALDHHAYAKGFEDGRDVALPKLKPQIEFAKGPSAESIAIKPAR